MLSCLKPLRVVFNVGGAGSFFGLWLDAGHDKAACQSQFCGAFLTVDRNEARALVGCDVNQWRLSSQPQQAPPQQQQYLQLDS